MAGKTSFDIALAEDRDELDEVVVIGYGTVKKRDLTGAVASVSGDKLKANPVSNVAQALQLYPRKGTIEVGSDADLVMLDRNLEIDTVMAMGKIAVRDGSLCVRNYYDYQ